MLDLETCRIASAGMLIGSGLIGWIADIVGLTSTLAALVPVLATVALASRLPEKEMS